MPCDNAEALRRLPAMPFDRRFARLAFKGDETRHGEGRQDAENGDDDHELNQR